MQCLDTGAEFPFPAEPTDPKVSTALGYTLLQLLESLPEPVVPVSLHGRCIAAATRDAAFEVNFQHDICMPRLLIQNDRSWMTSHLCL